MHKKLFLIVLLLSLIYFSSGTHSLVAGSQIVFRGARRDFRVGDGPTSVVIGDFNRDGIADLAVANYASANISILVGRGDGTFGPAQNFAVGNGPSSVAIGDFNGDEIQDLVVTNQGGYYALPGMTVSILLGNGDGTFGSAQTFPTGSGPSSVAVGDFNQDEIPDLAVANRGSNTRPDNTVSILLGKGDGTFDAPRALTVGSGPSAVAAGDFDEDGIADLVVTNAGVQPAYGTTVSVLLGAGDGTFRPARDFAVGRDPRFVVVGDVDGDGHQDLAVVNRASSNVAILLGQGDGTFEPAQFFNTFLLPEAAALGDFDGDGIQDLAVVAWNNDDVVILLGRGDGTFSWLRYVGTSRGPSAVAVGDFNGDSIQDLAVTGRGDTWPTNYTVSVLLGQGDGAFSSPIRIGEGGLGPIKVGDFNGDGIQDLAAASGAGIAVFLGSGDAMFQPAMNYTLGPTTSIAIGDFNGDEVQDLAATLHSGMGAVLLGNPDGTFQSPRYFPVVQDPHPVTLGDSNGDGLPNIAAGAIALAVTVGDFNGDGLQDLAVANGRDNVVSVLLGDGDGTFQPPRHFVVCVSPSSIAVGDFNEDGIQDLAVACGTSGNVAVLLGTGEGSFLRARYFPARQFANSIAMGDFNGDGHQDLAVTYPDGISILFGNGDGTFQRDQVVRLGSGTNGVIVYDFDGDAIPDLAVADWTSYNVSILLGTGDKRLFDAPQSFGIGPNPGSIAVGDFNNDDRPDLAVASRHGIIILLNDTGTIQSR